MQDSLRSLVLRSPAICLYNSRYPLVNTNFVELLEFRIANE